VSAHVPVTAEELAEAARVEWMGEILPAARAVDLMHRLARDLADARHDLDTERKASAMLADRNLDLGRELEALRAAVRAHEAHARAYCRIALAQRDLDLWSAAKVTP